MRLKKIHPLSLYRDNKNYGPWNIIVCSPTWESVPYYLFDAMYLLEVVNELYVFIHSLLSDKNMTDS